ncbi:MAG: hypothetical protein AABX79_01050 [Nanoarchaeota archaeon]
MNITPRLSLEEILTKGLAEARVLINKDKPLLADYTLFLIRQEYSNKGKMVPQEILKLEEQIKRKILSSSFKQIQTALQNKEYKKAAHLFVTLVPFYNKQHKKIPLELYALKEAIDSGFRESGLMDSKGEEGDYCRTFSECYPREFFTSRKGVEESSHQ